MGFWISSAPSPSSAVPLKEIQSRPALFVFDCLFDCLLFDCLVPDTFVWSRPSFQLQRFTCCWLGPVAVARYCQAVNVTTAFAVLVLRRRRRMHGINQLHDFGNCGIYRRIGPFNPNVAAAVRPAPVTFRRYFRLRRKVIPVKAQRIHAARLVESMHQKAAIIAILAACWAATPIPHHDGIEMTRDKIRDSPFGFCICEGYLSERIGKGPAFELPNPTVRDCHSRTGNRKYFLARITDDLAAWFGHSTIGLYRHPRLEFC